MSELLDRLKQSAQQRQKNQDNQADTAQTASYWWIHGVGKTTHTTLKKTFSWRTRLLVLSLCGFILGTLLALFLSHISPQTQPPLAKDEPGQQSEHESSLPELVVHETEEDFKKLMESEVALSVASEDGKLLFEEKMPLSSIMNNDFATVDLDKTEHKRKTHLSENYKLQNSELDQGIDNKVATDQTLSKQNALPKQGANNLNTQPKKTKHLDILSQAKIRQRIIDHMLAKRAQNLSKTANKAHQSMANADIGKTDLTKPAVTSTSVDDWTKLPSYNDLPEDLAARLPELNFSAHLYSADNPNIRMVIIRGVTLGEGDMVDKNLRLEQITPEGVVFLFESTAFYLKVRE